MAKLKRKPFFYDAQLKRILVQLLSCFSGYQVMTGTQRDGKPLFLDVPVIYGDMSRVAGYILRDASENIMPYLPVMGLYMTGLNQKAEMRQNPQHIEKFRVIERGRDPDGNLLVNVPGKKKTIERFMAIPYDLELSLSIWASNNDQGYQLIEQLATQFNPEVDIQLSNSPADWTFLTSLFFNGQVNFEKVTPTGTENDPFYVYTLGFRVTVWMNPPVKVYETKAIYEIDVPIYELENELSFEELERIDGLVIKADEQDIIKFETFGTSYFDKKKTKK